MNNLDKIKRMKRAFYEGTVTEIKEDYVKAKFKERSIEIELEFPRQVLAHHLIINVGDNFRYFPSERNELNIFNVNDFYPA